MAAINRPECPGHEGSWTMRSPSIQSDFCQAYAEGVYSDFEEQGLFNQAKMEGCLVWIRSELGQSTLRLLQQREISEHAAREVLASEQAITNPQQRGERRQFEDQMYGCS